MNSVIYPAGLKIYFQKNEINSVADYKTLNGNIRSDAFYEDKLQTISIYNALLEFSIFSIFYRGKRKNIMLK